MACGKFAIAHIGCTAVPGLDAKPVIDILLIAPAAVCWPPFVVPLRALGYVPWADNPRRDRLFFVKGVPPFGTKPHPSSARAHADDAARYAALERELAAAHADDGDAYTEGKTGFIEAILQRAKAPAANATPR